MMSRAVAYLNTDMCVSGPSLDATASPALKGQYLKDVHIGLGKRVYSKGGCVTMKRT